MPSTGSSKVAETTSGIGQERDAMGISPINNEDSTDVIHSWIDVV